MSGLSGFSARFERFGRFFFGKTAQFAQILPKNHSKTAQDMIGLSGFSARFERFERFGRFRSFIFGKTAQTAQILLKKPLKNRSFLAVIFERFFKQDLSGF